VTALPCLLLTDAATVASEIPWTRAAWVGHFLEAVAAKAEDGIALLRQIERDGLRLAGRRRASHATAAIDMLAAAPLRPLDGRDRQALGCRRRVCRAAAALGCRATVAWLNRKPRLAKDFATTLESALAWLFLVSVKLLTRRPARALQPKVVI
jgi:hypothetical protein